MNAANLFRPSLRSLYNNGIKRLYCCEIDPNKYQKLSNETLESLNDRFSELIEDHDSLMGADTNLADGVLTVKLNEHGTYVINKQTPNQQIWLSSPVSGPYRYDIFRNSWVYKHTGETMHALLDRELPKFIQTDPKFRECFMGGDESY